MKASELVKELQDAMMEMEIDPEVMIVERETTNPKYGKEVAIKELLTTCSGDFWLVPTPTL